jgi:hypothetical protein
MASPWSGKPFQKKAIQIGFLMYHPQTGRILHTLPSMEEDAGRSKRPRLHVDPEYRRLLGVSPSTAADQSFTAQFPGIRWERFPQDLSVAPFHIFQPNQVPLPVLLAFFWDILAPELYKGCSAYSPQAGVAQRPRVFNLIEALKIAAEPLAAPPLERTSQHASTPTASPTSASQPEPQAPTPAPEDEENDLSGMQVGNPTTD